jgi:hypothetical protein
MRASCRRPAVAAKCEVYQNEAAAIVALLAFKPQLVCVKSKHEMMELAKNDCIKRRYQMILLHYRELPGDDKERAFSALHSDTGTTLVIATSGITTGRRRRSTHAKWCTHIQHDFTGTNPQALFRTLVWKDIWSIENAIQCIGRTARKPGQVGSAKLMSWHSAVQARAGSEFARLASIPATFFEEAVRIIDCDRGSNSNARAPSVFTVSFEGSKYYFIIDIFSRYSQFSCIISSLSYDNFWIGLAHGCSTSSRICSATFAVLITWPKIASSRVKTMLLGRFAGRA